ncbi:hypothetical protein B0T46_05440 [Nocardia donostiensis]|uniref:Uncharacterized protein n=1 Tax=Nocardia donostiensis TaxID=1538463 RepID=A0A1V2TJZ9_9NOCA|nr:hypothetical protein [Nocardia donostiensis]ONM49839.1 hypothetical protein B0T46_05440 [Nocardia donostiensis]OQS12702.1 hypothetical protein B0T36_23770 [Nocardia donostiensis]
MDTDFPSFGHLGATAAHHKPGNTESATDISTTGPRGLTRAVGAEQADGFLAIGSDTSDRNVFLPTVSGEEEDMTHGDLGVPVAASNNR